MEKAKAAVTGFLSKDGKHDTTVNEVVAPAVQQEHITPTRHEQAHTAVDREVHQHHHHTSVQPVHHKEVLPEQHTHNVAAVEHRQVVHGNDEHIKQRLAAEQAAFKNTREVGGTQVTGSAAPVVAGEHVHHHVHEVIQPIINKETVQPTVVHTTVPIHEVHQNEAKHHNATHLPPVTLKEFEKNIGSVNGREERTDAFAGEPKSMGSTLGGHGAAGTTSITQNESAVSHGSSGPTATTTGTNNKTGQKASVLDKLNPKKDANHDGKAGVMS
eukprot:GHVU01022561.1.p1 GENE.GHVU01022561.1~~GHVU01022561.1.p1  ORF type:complete len:271 (+),score=47.53 GHVU01022561.1:102-914(+)